jgi:hypothetical protein
LIIGYTPGKRLYPGKSWVKRRRFYEWGGEIGSVRDALAEEARFERRLETSR